MVDISDNSSDSDLVELSSSLSVGSEGGKCDTSSGDISLSVVGSVDDVFNELVVFSSTIIILLSIIK